ncbi:hypothetical protein [Nocardioides guangzhouensis]|nr:hypothetical protein [Nocardioides guangzhouensis]
MSVLPSGPNLRPEPRRGPSARPRSTRGRGFLVGAAVGGVFLVMLLLDPELTGDPYGDSRTDTVGLVMLYVALAIAALGFVTAAVLTFRRATTRLGQGMLVGLTVTIPLAVLFLILVAASQMP